MRKGKEKQPALHPDERRGGKVGENSSFLADTCASPPSTAPVEWADAGEPDPSDAELWEALYSYAPKVVDLAKSYGISILMLQPLNQFEGWAKGTKRAEWSRAKAQKWLPLCAKLGVEQIQVSGADDPRVFFSLYLS